LHVRGAGRQGRPQSKEKAMKKLTTKKLVLAKQTIRELARSKLSVLQAVAGGMADESLGCWYTAGSNQQVCCA
jgi:hypothetical protein